MQGAIGFGFASHWLKNWRESFKPITKRSIRNHVITFDSHLKTALKKPNGLFDDQPSANSLQLGLLVKFETPKMSRSAEVS